MNGSEITSVEIKDGCECIDEIDLAFSRALITFSYGQKGMNQIRGNVVRWITIQISKFEEVVLSNLIPMFMITAQFSINKGKE